MASPNSPKPKRGFRVTSEAILIGVVVVFMGVILSLIADSWKTAPHASSHASTNAKPGLSLTHNFTGDPLAGTGWWGAQTSSLNFCEEDYVFTPTIAELINTLSNFAYVYYAWTTWPKESKWPPISNVSLLIVGLTSAIYHASLKHNAEVADESGMYLLTASMDWYLYSYPGAIFSGKVSKPVYGTLLWGACAAVIYKNFMADGADFGIHLLLFVGLLTGLWPRCMWLISERRKMEKAGKMPVGAIKAKALRRTFRIGASCFLLGFGTWLVDCAFCHELRAFRRTVGLPLAWLTEMHAYWHILTAVGAGMFIQLTHTFSSKEHGNIPITEGTSKAEVNKKMLNGHTNGGNANGHLNGYVNGQPKNMKTRLN